MHTITIYSIKTRFLRKSLLLKNKVNIIGNNKLKIIIYIPFYIYILFHTKKALKKQLQKIMIKYNKKYTEYITNNGGSYSFKKETIKKIWINTLITHKFEEYNYFIPKEYDAFLTHVYGEYMKLPPIEERSGRHKILNIDFGNYKIKSGRKK